MTVFRKRVAGALVASLAATVLATVTTPEPASAAGGPSVKLPTTPSTSVTSETVGTRGQDQASLNAMSRDQTPGGAVKGGLGTAKATSLAPSATWDVSPHTGDFTWSYPLRVPPAPGGLEPELALSYTSSAVDGRTSATNNQASWVGDGWDLSPGFVERAYGGCAEDTMGDTTPPDTIGDLCWRSDNAVASFNGGGGHLVCCDGTGRWRFKNDDGSRIERLSGAANGDEGTGADDTGEHWRITKVDGTQLFFGSRPESKSTWTVPVFGDDRGEPCNKPAGFATSHCAQAWRWNLDRIVDRNGNTIVYTYVPETNFYGRNGTQTAASYVRGGTLQRIEYGMRAGQAASGEVEFVVADRCVPDSTCVPDKKENWPDVPWDDNCAGTPCQNKLSPTFWSTKRLSKIITRVRGAGGFTDVDSWTLEQLFPRTGDGEKATLWLKRIVHAGHVGGELELPAVTFEGTMMANRVFKVDGLAPLTRYRITGIVSETGGLITVNYADPDCVEGASMPANPETNGLRCFPVTWRKDNISERTDYFHKYVVERVVQSDRFTDLPRPITANIQQVTTYEYLDGAAWHYDMSEFTKEEKKTWDEFRGYGRVRIRTGVAGDTSGPSGMTEKRFYRGMYGDRLAKPPNEARRTDTVQATEGPARADLDQFQGSTLETIVYDRDQVVSKTIEDPVTSEATATRGQLKAYIVRTGGVEARTALASGGWRITRSESTYDDRGLVKTTSDLGDRLTSADDRCVSTWYARNEDAWLMSLPSRVETVAVRCGADPSFPDDAISDERYTYDGSGNLLTTKSLSDRPAVGDPEHYVTGSYRYDVHGRVIESRDAREKLTRIAYTPATGGPVTGMVVTNPVGHTITTTLHPAWGLPASVVDANRRRTETAYDALGRTTQVWLPNRSRTTFPDAGSAKFSYLIRGGAPSVVTSSALNPRGEYVTTKEIYDGLLRLRQKQVPAVGGGRLLTDTRYDSQGRVYKTTQPYFNDAAIDDNIWVASDVEVPGLTVTKYDGAGRKVAEIYQKGADPAWQTTIRYGGDRVHMEPPAGGTATTVITDARGQTTDLRQYHGGSASGSYDATTYTYTKAGRPASTKDPAGNVWRSVYDIRGNLIRSDDPDKGVATMTYDDAGQLVTATDARGVTLTTSYDDLGRRLSVKSGSDTLAAWTYDTAHFGLGQPATSTRYVDGAAFTTSFDYYTELYHPVETKVTIPESPRAQTLAGTYLTESKLNVDGSPKGTTLPAIGDLEKETVSWEYDDIGNPVKLTGGPVGTPTFDYVRGTAYTRYGEVARLEMGAVGKRAWLSFYYDDHTRRLTRSIVDAEVPRPMQTDVNYTYDPAGNITSIANTPMDLPHDVQCFTYDHLRRLTEAWTPTGGCGAAPAAGSLGGAAPYWHSYTYDGVGNRLTETQHGAVDTVRTYNYPAAGAHQLESVTTAGPGATPRTDRFAYDSAGNTMSRPGQALEWDELGKLAQISEGDKKTRFVYDADGDRLLREDPTSITLYLDGQDLKLTKATGEKTATRYYQHGDLTVATRTAAGVKWQASDHQDTAQVAIDVESQKVTQRRQAPFGAPRGTPVPWAGERGFVGGTVDSSTGLTELGARQYDPLLGRFLSVDPLIDTTDPQQMHGYTYGNNNPVTFSDPTGLFWGWVKRNILDPVGTGLKHAWHGVRTVAKHAAPLLGYVALVLGSSTPVGLAVAALVAVGINTIGSCVEDRKLLGCIAHATEFAPGISKLAMGAVKTGSIAFRSTRTAAEVREAAEHLGTRPGQWLVSHTLGKHTKAIEAGGWGVGTYYYGTCGLKTVDCYGKGTQPDVGEAGDTPEGGTPQYIRWIWPSNYVGLPKPFYRHDFVGPMLAGGTRAKNAAEWQYGPGGKWTNTTNWGPPPPTYGAPSPPRRSTPGPNNSYYTGDGRTCNRGGGMCAV